MGCREGELDMVLESGAVVAPIMGIMIGVKDHERLK